MCEQRMEGFSWFKIFWFNVFFLLRKVAKFYVTGITKHLVVFPFQKWKAALLMILHSTEMVEPVSHLRLHLVCLNTNLSLEIDHI